jgi:hypothetical protein
MKKAVGVEGIPHVLIIDSTGVVRWQGFPQGEEKLTEEIIQRIIDADKAANHKEKSGKPDSKPASKKPEPAPKGGG